MTALGLHLRAGDVIAGRWPQEPAPTLVPGCLTYRGEHVRLGAAEGVVVTTAEILDLLHGTDLEPCRTYLALLTRELSPMDGPVVVAVPAGLAGDPAALYRLQEILAELVLPVTRVVAAPVAAVAYAYVTDALRQPPVAAPTVVCDLDDRGAEITVLSAVPHVIRPGVTTPVAAPDGLADRAGVIGHEVVEVVRAAGLGDEPIRLLVTGEPGPAAEVFAAAKSRHGTVHPIRLADPRAAIAVGAASIAAGAVVVEDRYRYGVSLSGHRTDFEQLAEQWPQLAVPDTIAVGRHGPAVEVDVAAGQVHARVRLTDHDGAARDVEVPLHPPLTAGVYQVSFTVTADGPALHFEQSGKSAVFPVPGGG